MHADVDMSGRIEETNRPTAVAMANGVHYSVLISAREKRRAIKTLQQARPKRDATTIHVRIFAILLFWVLRQYLFKLQQVTVDVEYPGHEATIKNMVLTLSRKHKLRMFADQIIFAQVGKKSPSHGLAYSVYKGKRQPERRVTAEAIVKAFGQ